MYNIVKKIEQIYLKIGDRQKAGWAFRIYMIDNRFIIKDRRVDINIQNVQCIILYNRYNRQH